MPIVRAKNERYILNDTLHVIIPHLGTRLHFVAKECYPVFHHCKAWWLCLKTYSVQHTRTNSTTYLTSKGGGAFFWKTWNIFSTRGTRLGQNLKFFPKNYYWWLPWERKSKNKGAKQRTHCCAQVVNFSLKSNSRLVITSTYRLHSWRLSYFPPPADPLPISAGCSFAIVPIYFAEPAELSICLPSTSCVAWGTALQGRALSSPSVKMIRIDLPGAVLPNTQLIYRRPPTTEL